MGHQLRLKKTNKKSPLRPWDIVKRNSQQWETFQEIIIEILMIRHWRGFCMIPFCSGMFLLYINYLYYFPFPFCLLFLNSQIFRKLFRQNMYFLIVIMGSFILCSYQHVQRRSHSTCEHIAILWYTLASFNLPKIPPIFLNFVNFCNVLLSRWDGLILNTLKYEDSPFGLTLRRFQRLRIL